LKAKREAGESRTETVQAWRQGRSDAYPSWYGHAVPTSEKERLLNKLDAPIDDLHLPPESRLERTRAFKRLRGFIEKLLYERHMDTAGLAIEVEHFEHDFVHYQPSRWLPMRWAFRKLRLGPDDVFVEFGCGKGRVVCEAARHPLARVIGVEVSPRLVEQARANVERGRGRFKCQDIEIITADATGWAIPDDMTVAYLNYPFVGDTFRRVIDNIDESIVRNPREVRLVYMCPALEDYILHTTHFRLVAKRRGRGERAKSTSATVSLYQHDASTKTQRAGAHSRPRRPA
jgi:precorrin-6B methylase 2